jgi:DNA-directed RNA polymerase sigma subunit (sigma70/sigma32)
MRQELTPSQRLWVEAFGIYGLPKLNENKVLAILDSLPKRQQQAVRLRFGFGGVPLSFENLRRVLPRADGKMGVSKELARLEVRRAIHYLRQPSKRKAWQEAEL